MTTCTHNEGRNYFVRYGPEACVVGPFKHRHTALAWLWIRGFRPTEEGATFKVYEADAPGSLTLSG